MVGIGDSGGPTDRIYHFTHVDNLAAILGADGLVADSGVDDDSGSINVGDPGVKSARRHRLVTVEPGGSVADYVPFYFAPRSPMMFRIACDHRDSAADRYADGDDPLIYLVSSLERVAAAGLAWVASDGNAAAAVSRFTNQLEDLAGFVDWSLMRETMWRNTPEDPDRRRRRMAELLVHRQVPLAAVLGFATRSEQRASEVRTILNQFGHQHRYVGVRSAWYYGY